jgi:hypothetical protein
MPKARKSERHWKHNCGVNRHTNDVVAKWNAGYKDVSTQPKDVNPIVTTVREFPRGLHGRVQFNLKRGISTLRIYDQEEDTAGELLWESLINKRINIVMHMKALKAWNPSFEGVDASFQEDRLKVRHSTQIDSIVSLYSAEEKADKDKTIKDIIAKINFNNQLYQWEIGVAGGDEDKVNLLSKKELAEYEKEAKAYWVANSG